MSHLLLACLAGAILLAGSARALRTDAGPSAGIALALSGLSLRAALAVSVAIVCLGCVPRTATFELLTHWYLHAGIPYLTGSLGLGGHSLGGVAIVVPAAVLFVSLAVAVIGVCRAARSVQLWLRSGTVGSGPSESLVVDEDRVMLAAAGLRSPSIVVSAGALRRLDSEELTAAIRHERAHIVRGHRFLFLVGGLLHSLGRALPGSRSELAHLRFSLERDADELAARGASNRLALASAICKAAAPVSSPALTTLSGAATSRRVAILIEENPVPASPWPAWCIAGLNGAVALATLAAALLAVA